MEATYWFVGSLLAASLVFFGVGRWLHTKEAGRGSRLVVYNHAIQGIDSLLLVGGTLAPTAAVAEGFYLLAAFLFLLIPLTWFLFSLAYAYPERLTRRVKLAVGGYVVLMGGVILTNPLHRRYSSEARFVSEPFPHMVTEPTVLGALSYVSYVVFLAGVVALIYRLVTTLRASRGQLGALLVGLLFPVVYVPIVSLGVLPATVQDGASSATLGYMLVGSTWPSALVAWAVYRYQLFDVVPLARESIFEDRDEPVLVLDADRRVIDYNRSAVETFPAVEGHTGTPLRALVPDLLATVGGADEPDPDGGDGFADTITRYTDSGPREYAVGVSRLSTDEGVQGYALVVRDVTEREQYVRDLEQQTAQLERFASTLSHDLRNPLNVAQGRVQMAIERGTTEGLESAVAAHERIQAMIEDLLTLAREGETIDEMEPVSLAGVARSAWETTDTPTATLRVGDDADVAIYADAGRLQTVFENLFRNSVEHGSTGSRSQAHENSVEHAGEAVTVRVGTVPGGFFVEDDGPGVPPEEREEIFEFGHTSAQDGTGLGLAIVDSIASAHGWSVSATDGSDGGLRVVFESVDVAAVADDAATGSETAS